jgi:hypothetical protein
VESVIIIGIGEIKLWNGNCFRDKYGENKFLTGGNMKRIALILALAISLLLMVGCSDTEDELSEADILQLNIPQDFNYEMYRSVEIDISGAYRLPLSIRTKDNNLLFKAQMNPVTGIKTKLTLPKTIEQVVLAYQMHEITISVTDGEIAYDFSNRDGR